MVFHSPLNFSTVGNDINYAANWENYPKKRKMLITITYSITWRVWKAMNDKVFKKTHTTPSKIADNVIFNGFWVGKT